MKIPPGLVQRSRFVVTAAVGFGVLSACVCIPHPPSNANYVFEFRYEQKPNPLQFADAERLRAILLRHNVRGELRLNGVSIPLPPAKKIKTGLAMAYTKSGGEETSGSSKTQLAGTLEADNQSDLNGALKEFAGTR